MAENLYLIMIETFDQKIKRGRYDREVMLYGAVFADKTNKAVKQWIELDLDSGFPENLVNKFEHVKDESIIKNFPEEKTHNSTYKFVLLETEGVLQLMQETKEELEKED